VGRLIVEGEDDLGRAFGDLDAAEAHDLSDSSPLARTWPLWWSLAVLAYAIVFALQCGFGLAFAPYLERQYEVERLIVAMMFPVGDVAYALVNVIAGFLRLLVDPVIALPIAAMPAIVLALPIGAAHGAVVATAVRLIVVVVRRAIRRRMTS
jgi:hypothetical protein